MLVKKPLLFLALALPCSSIAQTMSMPVFTPCGKKYVFSSSGTHTLEIPKGCSAFTIKAWGAGGGAGAPTTSYNGSKANGGNGAAGGFAQTTINLSGPLTLTIAVGSGGGAAELDNTSILDTGGGGGGGATAVLNVTTNTVYAVAGGGGGGGGANDDNLSGSTLPGGNGGVGGGSNGFAGSAATSTWPGRGGSASSGGAAGASGLDNPAPSAGGTASGLNIGKGGNGGAECGGGSQSGGTGGASLISGYGSGGYGEAGCLFEPGGGGGGGGYHGGGGGNAGDNNDGGSGGGGGSSLTIGTNSVKSTGVGMNPLSTDEDYVDNSARGGASTTNPMAVNSGTAGAVVIITHPETRP